MVKEKKGIEHWVIGSCIAILVFIAFSLAVRLFTRVILIEYYEIDNAFTEFVWFDNPYAGKFGSGNNVVSATEDIEWEKLYPFDDNKYQSGNDESNQNKLISKIHDVVKNVADAKDEIESYVTDYIIFHSQIVETANLYEKLIGWNFASFNEYNGVVELSEGYFAGFAEEKDMTQQYEALSDLYDYCKKKGLDFLYVQAPSKISEYDDTEVSGILDFSNQNVNSLLSKLDDSDIDYFDIREVIHNSGINNHTLFYNTDHHWLTTTGLWAAQNILAFCNDTYKWNANISLLEANQFDYVTYKDWFLGSQGKKITLSRCEPDDFTLIYPKYETKYHYIVPDKMIDTVGDYSVVYDMSHIDICDYYNKNPYAGLCYGDRPLVQIENLYATDNKKILIIHDSFGDCVIPCLALAENAVDALDLRYFTGSVKTYIEESQPDIVIVMYNSGIGGEIDYSSHNDLFDFR
jgi:hypothetical protein